MTARAGDDIWVSGTLGAAALALAARRGRIRLAAGERRRLEQKLHAPAPRIALGAALRSVARSAIDVSDGLVADLGHICERSGVSAIIERARVPLPVIEKNNINQIVINNAILSGGDDYELVFSAGSARRDAIARLATRLRVKLTRIGKVIRRRKGPLVTVLDAAGRPVAVTRGGYEHF